MIDSVQHHDSNRHPLTSLSQIKIKFKGILKSVSFPILRSMADLLVRVRECVSEVIGHRFEKVRNGHRFENLKKDMDLRIWKKDIDLRYWCLWLEIRHGIDDWTYIDVLYVVKMKKKDLH